MKYIKAIDLWTYGDAVRNGQIRLQSGQWVRLGPDGQLSRYRFVGRLKDLIIRGGFNIAPEEIELLLADHPKLADVAAGHQVACHKATPTSL